jgi:DNA polymerase I-like protein with 3'-5' exonuclease and polymerase domains
MNYLDSLPEHLIYPNPSVYEHGKWICLDLETTNQDFGHARVVDNRIVYGYAQDWEGRVFEIYHEHDLKNGVPWDEYDFVIAHNAKFECQWMDRAGCDVLHTLFFDTMMAEFQLLGNRWGPLDLDQLGYRYTGVKKDPRVAWLMDAGVCPSTIPESWLQGRCKQDVLTTIGVYKAQMRKLKERNLLGCTYTASCFVPVAADIEMTGMCLDPDLVWVHYEKDVGVWRDLEDELEKFTGGINMGSPAQVAHYLYENLGFKELVGRNGQPKRNKPSKQFPEGQPLTDSDSMELLKATNARQRKFLELKKAESKVRKRVNTYLQKFVDAVEENDCMIYGRVNQAVARTHRLSWWKVGQRDYDQLEYRAAGDLSQCPVARATVDEGTDVHFRSASIITPEIKDLNPDSKEYSELRTKAKPHTFKPLYGGTSGTDKEQEYYKWFMAHHTGIGEWHDKLIDEALQTKQVVLPTGMIFYFPKVKITRSGYIEEQQRIKNYPVQYFATAEIVIIGTFLLWSCLRLHNMKTFIVNEVHDAVITEEAEDEHEIVEGMAQECLVDGVKQYLEQVYDYTYTFPLTYETKLATNWGYNKP